MTKTQKTAILKKIAEYEKAKADYDKAFAECAKHTLQDTALRTARNKAESVKNQVSSELWELIQ